MALVTGRSFGDGSQTGQVERGGRGDVGMKGRAEGHGNARKGGGGEKIKGVEE